MRKHHRWLIAVICLCLTLNGALCEETPAQERIAPAYPSPDELAAAMELFCLAVKLAALEKLIAQRA